MVSFRQVSTPKQLTHLSSSFTYYMSFQSPHIWLEICNFFRDLAMLVISFKISECTEFTAMLLFLRSCEIWFISSTIYQILYAYTSYSWISGEMNRTDKVFLANNTVMTSQYCGSTGAKLCNECPFCINFEWLKKKYTLINIRNGEWVACCVTSLKSITAVICIEWYWHMSTID
jgi:hypothetical protein